MTKRDLVRKRFERLIEPEVINEAAWTALLRRVAVIDKVAEGKKALESLLPLYEFARDAVEADRETAPRLRADYTTHVVTDARMSALAALTSRWADTSPAVTSFRDEVLGGTLVTLEDVPAWIAARAREEEAGDGEAQFGLRYFDGPEDHEDPFATMRVVFAREGGTLHRLWEAVWESSFTLGGRLSMEAPYFREGQREPWSAIDEARGVDRVLSGAAQRIDTVRVVLQEFGNVPALNTITLKVSARVSPRELYQLYQQARIGYGVARDRALGEKSLALARLADDYRLAVTRREWKDLREEWNKAHPEWAFKQKLVTQFANACRDAWESLTGLEWPDTRRGAA